MPPPLNVDREAARMLVLTVGVCEAARRMGISESTVKAWSRRGKWLADTRPRPALIPPPPTMARATSASLGVITSPADALADALADDSRETRVSLSKSARKMAKQAESADMCSASDVVHVAKAASIVHGWEKTGATDGKPHVRLQLIASGCAGVAAQLDVM